MPEEGSERWCRNVVKFLSAAILFYIFLRRQLFLAQYIDPPRHLRLPEEGSEIWCRNVANSRPSPYFLPILRVAAMFSTVEPR